jgi:hypothetical protein
MLADWYQPAAALPAFQAIQQALMANPMIAKVWQRHEQSPE